MTEQEKKEFKQLWNESKMGGCSTTAFAVVVIILLLCGCKTKSVIEKESTKDSVRTEYIEKIVKVPVKVYVEVPVESKQIVTNDTTSTLSTQFATSTASIMWNDSVPFLSHSLENIPQKIEKEDSVPVKEIVRTEYKTRKVTYTKTVTIKKDMRWWQKGLQYIGLFCLIWFMVYLSKFFLRR